MGRRSTRPDEPAVAAPRAPADVSADLSAEASADPSAGPSCDPCSHPASDAVGPCPRGERTDDDLRAAARLLGRRVWTVRRADRVAELLGRARWALLEHGDAAAGAHVARQSAELARLLSQFARREGAAAATGRAVRLVLMDEPWRLGEALHDRGAARARRVLLVCPVVAYGAGLPTGVGAWAVFAAPAETDLSPWLVGRRDLLTDLGPG